jgi:hypothetical protein
MANVIIDGVEYAPVMTDWCFSNERLLYFVQGLRAAADPNGNCDIGDLWGYCEEAADVIEQMMRYEAEHGLRSAIE